MIPLLRRPKLQIVRKSKQTRVREAIAQIDKHVADLLYRARRSHVVSLEALIAQYQHDLWHVAETYTSKLEGAIDNEKLMHTQLVQMVSHLERIGESYAEKAANLGFERCLKDLVLYGYLKAYQTPVIAPGEYSRPAVLANHDYLHHSLLPDLHAVLSTTADIAKVYGTFANRIKMYGHYLWRVAEEVYCNGALDFDAKFKATLKEVGTETSGNLGHKGIPGHKGGSLPNPNSKAQQQKQAFLALGNNALHYKHDANIKDLVDRKLYGAAKKAIASKEQWPTTGQQAPSKVDEPKTDTSKILEIVNRDGIINGEVTVGPSPFKYAFTTVAVPKEFEKIVTDEVERNINKIPETVRQVEQVSFSTGLKTEDMAWPYSGYAGLTINPTSRISFKPSAITDNPPFGSTATVPARMSKTINEYAARIVDHEMGHVYYNALTKTDAGQSQLVTWHLSFAKVQETKTENNNVFKWSRYGGSDQREAFAEAYTSYLNHDALIPPSYKSFFEKSLHGHTLSEADAQSKSREPIMYLCGFGVGPTYHLYADGVVELIDSGTLKEVGTAASGNWGHLSVKGHQGGSAPSSHSYSDAPFLNFPEAVKQSSLYKRNSEFKAAYDSGNLDLAYQIHNADFTARMDQTFGSTETPTVSADQVSSGAGIAAAQYIRDNYAGVETLDRYHSALATLNDAVTNTNLPLSAGLAELHNAAAAHWDKQYPNGGELYRGLSPNGGQKFTSTYNEGDVIKLTPLFSTTDNAGFARQFLADFHDRGDEAMTPGGVALTFKGVTGADLAVSYHTSDAFKQPGGVGDKEILMLGKRSWRITSMKKDPSGYGQSAVLEPTNVASKEAAFDSDDIAWRNCLREIGTASSGFHGHVGVYGHQGGSAPAGTGWKKISGPMGSNPGGVYASPDGTKHYVKLYANKEQGQSEILANKIYNHLGILAPDSTHVIVDGKDGVASPMLDGAKSMNASEIRSHSGYAKGVVADAYLANHDVIGLVNDNILRVGDNAVRIDNGGAMFFRAQGEPKEFGAKVDQLRSMFDPSRRIGTFTSGVPESERATQARHIVNSLSNSTIDRLTAESGLGQKYSSALKARRDDLAKHFGLLEIGTEKSGNLGHKGILGHKGGSLPNPNSAAQKQKSAFLATGENLHHYENNPKVKELVDKKLYGAAKKEIKAFPGGPVNTKPNSEMDSLDKFVKSGGFGTASKPETSAAEFVATHKADLQAKIDQVDLSSMNLPAGMNEANKVQLQARIANLKGISINDTLNMKPPVAGNNRGIKTALNNWSGTTDSPGALGLRAAINEMQDKEATHSFSKATLEKYNQILDAPNSGRANDMIAYRESIKANFKEFQAEQGRYFDKKYGPGTEQNATLYRGLRSREAKEVSKLNIGDSVVLPTARSYTLAREKTTNFTNAFEGTKYIIRLQNVSGKDHVFASQAHTNGGLHLVGEREVIVMGNHNEWEVSDIHKSDAYKTYVTLKPKTIKEAEVAKPKTLVLHATALDDDEAPVWLE